MTIEVEIREIKEMLEKLNRRLDALVLNRETLAMMAISQESLTDFLTGEPDLYSVKGVRLDKVATVSKSLMLGEIGQIGESLRREVNRKLLKPTNCRCSIFNP